jgi:hypothetical protein
MEIMDEKSEDLDYEKSKKYWENVEATNSGMLGNILEVSITGKLKFFFQNHFNKMWEFILFLRYPRIKQFPHANV